MKKIWALCIAVALLITTPLVVALASPSVDKDRCFFGMVSDSNGVNMRIQCGEDKPLDLDRCEVMEVKGGKKDKVFVVVKCCSAGGYCVSVMIPTEKQKI